MRASFSRTSRSSDSPERQDEPRDADHEHRAEHHDARDVPGLEGPVDGQRVVRDQDVREPGLGRQRRERIERDAIERVDGRGLPVDLVDQTELVGRMDDREQRGDVAEAGRDDVGDEQDRRGRWWAGT